MSPRAQQVTTCLQETCQVCCAVVPVDCRGRSPSLDADIPSPFPGSRSCSLLSISTYLCEGVCGQLLLDPASTTLRRPSHHRRHRGLLCGNSCCWDLLLALHPGDVEVVNVANVKGSLTVGKVEVILAPPGVTIAQLGSDVVALLLQGQPV